jgi:hypothetical protein
LQVQLNVVLPTGTLHGYGPGMRQGRMLLKISLHLLHTTRTACSTCSNRRCVLLAFHAILSVTFTPRFSCEERGTFACTLESSDLKPRTHCAAIWALGKVPTSTCLGNHSLASPGILHNRAHILNLHLLDTGSSLSA